MNIKKNKLLWTFSVLFLLQPIFLFGQLNFIDVGSDVGVEVALNIHGGAFFDFSNDGYADLFVPHNYSVFPEDYHDHATFRNLGDGTFEYVTNELGLQGYNVSIQGVTVGDYDNDGDVDIFLGMGGTDYRTCVYRNDGTHFSNVSGATMYQQRERGRCLQLFDYNNDGNVDLLVETSDYLTLFRNSGNATFTDATLAAQINLATTSNDIWGFAVGDYDNDNDMDIYIPRATSGSVFYKNDGDGTFSNATSEANLPSGELFKGALFFDYNNDGFLDLFIRGEAGVSCRLYENNQDSTFTNVTSSSGISFTPNDEVFGGGLLAEDFDNNGYIDLYLVSPQYSGNKFWRNNGDNTFSQIVSSINLDEYRSYHGAVSADYDLDGDLDIYVLRSGAYRDSLPDGSPSYYATLYNNQGNSNHWVHCKLEGVQSNRSAIGARVFLYNDNSVQLREISGGTSYHANSLPAEFGLGSNTMADSIVIYWPSGIIQRYLAVPGDTLYEITEAEETRSFSNFSISGSVKYIFDQIDIQGTDISTDIVPGNDTTTNASGQYTLLDIESGESFTITPQRDARLSGDDAAITAFDASLIARYSLGLHEFSSTQLTIADGDDDGEVNIWDAMLIARYVVEMPDIGDSKVGDWIFNPENYNYVSIDASYSEQNFEATLIGDVDGDWGNYANPQKGIGNQTDFQLSTMKSIGDTLELSLYYNGDRELFSLELTMDFVESGVQFDQVIPSELLSDFYCQVNSTENDQVRLAIFGVESIHNNCELFKFRFLNQGLSNDQIALNFSHIRINNEQPYSLTTAIDHENKLVRVDHLEIQSNMPNPFNPSTTINYLLPDANQVKILIYNADGQLVRTLFNGRQSAGRHVVYWNGLNDNDIDVASGIYICQINSEKSVVTRKMLKVK